MARILTFDPLKPGSRLEARPRQNARVFAKVRDGQFGGVLDWPASMIRNSRLANGEGLGGLGLESFMQKNSWLIDNTYHYPCLRGHEGSTAFSVPKME